MSSIILADGVHVATMHRADAPVGQRARFHTGKLFDNLPRLPPLVGEPGEAVFLHGYERAFEVEFACADTGPDFGVVLDSSAVREIRAALRYQFDHTTLIAVEDAQRDLFELLAERGVIDLRIMDNTGMEGSAAWVFDTVEQIVGPATAGRVWVSRVKARESRNHVVTLTAGPV